MVDLGGYVIILVETNDKRVKLYGSPADKADLEVMDVRKMSKMLQMCLPPPRKIFFYLYILENENYIEDKKNSNNKSEVQVAIF